jgi:hypothetical protein
LGGVGRQLLDHQVGTGAIQGGGALDVLDRFLHRGSVELSHLGLQWAEVDASWTAPSILGTSLESNPEGGYTLSFKDGRAMPSMRYFAS